MNEFKQAIAMDGVYSVEELNKLPEDIIRDLFQRVQLKKGETVSKKYVANYREYPYKLIDNRASLYQNYIDSNQDNLDAVAVFDGNNNRKITHRELIKLIDSFAAGLTKMGIGTGSRVAVVINGTYEEPAVLLAPNKIGAVLRYIDFTKNPQDVCKDIISFDPDLLIMDDMFLQMEQFVNIKGNPVIVLNPKAGYEKSNYHKFTDVVTNGADNAEDMKASEVDADSASVIINSSGTTGSSKAIVHSNSSINAAAQKHLYFNFPTTRGNFIFKSIPSHIGLGLITTLYTNLISGTTIIISQGVSPQQSIEEALKYLAGFKPFLLANGFDINSKLVEFFAPMFVRIIEQNIDAIPDLSHIAGMLAGGSKMSREELERQEKLFGSKGMTVPISNGYGQNEMAGAVASNDNTNNTNGSAGYPAIGTEVKVVDISTMAELEPCKEGRIIEKSSSRFIEYLNNAEETAASVIEYNGEKWHDSKDIGYFDENGYLFITGRVSRVLIRYDVKMSLDTIEAKIKTHSSIANCAVISVPENAEDVPVAFVELNKSADIQDISKILDEIQNSPNKLNDLEMPVRTTIVDTMPLLSTGKIDYQKLTEASK